MLTLIVRLRIRTGYRDEFLAGVRENAAVSILEPGCRRFDIVEHSGDSEQFSLYEIYDDADAFERHRASPHFRRWRLVADRCVVEQVNELGSLLPVAAAAVAGDAAIVRGDEARTVDRGGGVRTAYLVTGALGSIGFMNGVTEFEPGASLPMHSHNCEESVVVLDGAASFECKRRVVHLDAGDATWVPAGAPHRFSNLSDEKLRILWIYGRIDAARTFTETGETVRIDTAG